MGRATTQVQNNSAPRWAWKILFWTSGIMIVSGIISSGWNYLSSRGKIPPTPSQWVSLPDSELDPLIYEVSSQTGVDHRLIKAVIIQESGGNHYAVSPKGAMGLMQIMPGTARQYGVKDPYDPRQNILGGAMYMRDLLKKYKDYQLALAAYNCGEQCVDNLRPKNFSSISYRLPKETQDYVPSVMAILEGKKPAELVYKHSPFDSSNSSLISSSGEQKEKEKAKVLPEEIKEITAPVGEWSEPFTRPAGHSIYINPKGKIWIKTWSGKIIEDEPGKETWLGNRAGNSVFRVKSREEQEVPVEIVLQKVY